MTDFEGETRIAPLKNGDPHYEAIGRVASAWAHFEFRVSQLIWWIAAKDDERGACLTSNMLSINMRMNALLSLLDLEAQLHGEPSLHDKRPQPDTLPAYRKALNKLNNEEIARLSKERNRFVHDAWVYGKTTGQVGQIHATADKKLDYRLRARTLTEIDKVHKKILLLDWEFQLLAGHIRARLHLLQQPERPEQQDEAPQPR